MLTPRKKIIAGLLVLTLTLGLAATWWYRHSPEYANRLFDQAYAAFGEGRFEEAERLASQAYEIDSSRDDVALLAAKAAAELGDAEHAIRMAEEVSQFSPPLYAAAQLLSGQQSQTSTLRLAQAVTAYREVLSLDPSQIDANRGLVEIYGATGQQTLAIPALSQLIRVGQAGDALMLAARDNGVIEQREMLLQAAERAPRDPLPRIGLAWHANDSGDYAEAIRWLREAIAADPECAFAHAALGSPLIAAGQLEAAVQWHEDLPKSAESFPVAWIARGLLAEKLAQDAAAVGCYARALRLRPELMQPNARIALLLAKIGETDRADQFKEYMDGLQKLNETQSRVFFAGGSSGMDELLELISCYHAVARYWEAYGWTQLAAQIDPTRQDVRGMLASYAKQLTGAPAQLVDPRFTPVATLDVEAYPGLEAELIPNAQPEDAPAPSQFPFRLVQQANAGPQFEYYSGTDQPPLRMFEFTGGGLAIVDFDLDGWPDCFCTQGSDWPVQPANRKFLDLAFRNVGGVASQLPSHAWSEREVGYGQGITAGDLNSDGFVDIYIANAAGPNRLYLNNGDGTFTDVSDRSGLKGDAWTTSVAMADLDGDGHPDLYDVNYLEGADVYSRVCRNDRGGPALCRPFDFDGAEDSIWINDGNGSFREANESMLGMRPNGKGLGILLMSGDGDGRPRIFVANDTTNNFLFTSSGGGKYADRGTISGVAFNEQGRFEGSMGIAAADIDQNGWMDLLVTNFLYESNTLYMGDDANLFVDRTRGFDLEGPSLDVLGFGTQFLDLDRDGTTELFVANGHIDDRRDDGRPYEMPAQLFTLSGSQFVVPDPREVGEYFEEKWLGRSAVTVDWNRDGRQDLMVGHLYEPVATLINETPSRGDSLQFRLVGTESSRDAIGSRLMVVGDSAKRYAELTTGDGYQSFNEKVIHTGLGEQFDPQHVIVQWPNGMRERFDLHEVNREYLLIEGSGEPIERVAP